LICKLSGLKRLKGLREDVRCSGCCDIESVLILCVLRASVVDFADPILKTAPGSPVIRLDLQRDV
jgi:hypothetical protein